MKTTFTYELDSHGRTMPVPRDQARDFMNGWHEPYSVDGDRGERTYQDMYGDRLTIRAERGTLHG